MTWRTIFKWLLILAFLVGLYVAFEQLYYSNKKTPDYTTQKVSKTDIESRIVASGVLQPKEFVEVGAQVSGQLKKLFVEAGDQVKQGQLLAEIDASVLAIRVQVAEADLEVKQALLKQQTAELALAESRLKASQQLSRRNVISNDDIAKLKTDVKVLQAKISATKAQIKADKAKILGDKVTLNYSKIYAPINGTVANLEVREGQTLNANQNTPTILKIIDLNHFTLHSEVSEADVSKLYVGMLVEFATLGQTAQPLQTKIRRILPSPKIVNDVVLYQVLSDIDNNNATLMDAMTAQVFFIENRVQDALTVPLAAVQQNNGQIQVRKVVNGEIEWVSVTTGIKNRTHIQITSGLSEGDEVITGFKRFKKPNAKTGLLN